MAPCKGIQRVALHQDNVWVEVFAGECMLINKDWVEILKTYNMEVVDRPFYIEKIEDEGFF